MKKLLSILSTVAITGTAASTVVACTVPTTNIDVVFDDQGGKNGFNYDKDKKTYQFSDGDVYTADQLDTAMNGNFGIVNQKLPVAMSFDQLNQSLFNLVSFNQSLVVKTQEDLVQLKNFRDTFLGRDSNTVNSDKGIDTASVDGIKFNSVDDSNYYGAFSRTDINSLTGLWDLYNYVNNKGNLKVLGASASADIQKANKLFGEQGKDTDAKKLMEEFANSKNNPAFTKINYDLPLTTYHSQSQFFKETFASTDQPKKGDINLTDAKVHNYFENNTDVKMETSKDDNKSSVKPMIQDHAQSDPYAAVVINPDGNDPTNKDGFAVDEGLKKISEVVRSNDDAKKNRVLQENYANEGSDVYYYVAQDSSNSDKKNNSSLAQNAFGEYVVKKIAPFNITYTYNTDMNSTGDTSKAGSTNYTISMKLNNLAEVFTPYITPVQAASLTSVTKDKDGNAIIKFNKSFSTKQKDGSFKHAITGMTGLKIGDTSINDSSKYIQDDGSIKLDAKLVDGKSVTFTPQSDKDDKGTVRKASPLTYNVKFDGTKADKDGNTTITFTTDQLVWLFRGYKFLDFNNLNADEKDGTKFVDQQTQDDKATGAAVRNDDLSSEVTHNLRDMQSSDWEIKKA